LCFSDLLHPLQPSESFGEVCTTRREDLEVPAGHLREGLIDDGTYIDIRNAANHKPNGSVLLSHLIFYIEPTTWESGADLLCLYIEKNRTQKNFAVFLISFDVELLNKCITRLACTKQEMISLPLRVLPLRDEKRFLFSSRAGIKNDALYLWPLVAGGQDPRVLSPESSLITPPVVFPPFVSRREEDRRERTEQREEKRREENRTEERQKAERDRDAEEERRES